MRRRGSVDSGPRWYVYHCAQAGFVDSTWDSVWINLRRLQQFNSLLSSQTGCQGSNSYLNANSVSRKAPLAFVAVSSTVRSKTLLVG
jgi:hypothetical protein